MTRAMKWTGGSANNAGSVEYQYCLACDGALSKRFVYAGGTGASRGALQSGQRYEYDGLNLLRVDEIYGSTLSESGPWRTLEISTHQPGQLGALLHKRVSEYSSATSGSPSQTKDFTYSYDPVGNVYSVFDSNGNEAYYFTQDAFGNELPIVRLGGDNWNAARADRIVEHQTGKWIDEFSELYYFHARWYDSGVGRFVGRDPINGLEQGEIKYGEWDPCTACGIYSLAANSPLNYADPEGLAILRICSRGKATRFVPGTHCFMCWGDGGPRERGSFCYGCQIGKGAYPEETKPRYDYHCPPVEVSKSQYYCVWLAFKNCCAQYTFKNPISLLTRNCCDCVREALEQCGVKPTDNVCGVGVNCGL